jgi:glycosyltransferase involved in cell wall biosynthesis
MNNERRIKGLNLYATFSAGQGYSGMAEQFAIALNRIAPVSVVRFEDAPAVNISKPAWDLIKRPYRHEQVAVTIGFPISFDSMQAHKFRVGYTMFETDTLPNGLPWAGKTMRPGKAINENCDLLLVPCQHNVDVFRRAGVTVPIEVVHNGLHPTGFPLLDRSKREEGHKFTFLIMGTLSIRKNSGAVISAFIDLFKDKDDVRLIVKTQSGTHASMEFDKKGCGDIEVIDAIYTEKQMRQLMKEADCFVFPSHGEGFGLPPLEAAATGLPTIIAGNTGMLEYANPDYFLVVKSDETSPAKRYPKPWGDVGNWYEPDFEELKEKMLWAYEHQDEASAMGLRASEWVRREFDYRKVAQDMVAAIEKHMPVLE